MQPLTTMFFSLGIVMIVVGGAFFVAQDVSAGGSATEAASNPNACTAGNWVTKVNESIAGVIQIVCVGVSQEVASSPSACGAGNWLTQVTENAAGTLTLVCTAVLQEVTTTCAGGSGGAPHQYAMNETSAGAFVCALLKWASFTGFPAGCSAGNFVQSIGLTLTCAADNAAEAASSPSACSAGNWLTRVTEDAAGAISLTCTAPAQEVASTPTACTTNNWLTRVTEDAAGALTFTCAQPGFSSLSGTDTPTWANIVSFPAGCATGNFVQTIAASPTCAHELNVRITGDQSTTSGSCTNVPGMSISVNINTNYQLTARMYYTANAGTVGIRWCITLPASATMTVCVIQSTGTTAFLDGCTTSTGAAIVATAASCGATECMDLITGVIKIAGTSGSVQIQFNSETSTTVTAKADSNMFLIPIT